MCLSLPRQMCCDVFHRRFVTNSGVLVTGKALIQQLRTIVFASELLVHLLKTVDCLLKSSLSCCKCSACLDGRRLERASFLSRGADYHPNSAMLSKGKDPAYSLVKPGSAWLSLCSLVFCSINLKELLMRNPEKPRNN